MLMSRAVLGFVAAVLSVLVFHQAMWELLHLLGQMPPAYPTRGVPPFGVPLIIDLCFWGGLWGAAFGLVLPYLPSPSGPRPQDPALQGLAVQELSPRGLALKGLALGLLAALVGLFVVPLIKGLPVAGGWAPMAFVRSFLINGCWGIGVGLILPLLLRQSRRSRPDDARAARTF